MLEATRAPRRVSRGGRAQIVGEVLVADELLTYQFLQEGCRLPDNDGRDMGSWVSASPAVRRYRTSHEAVRSPRRLGKPAKKRQLCTGASRFCVTNNDIRTSFAVTQKPHRRAECPCWARPRHRCGAQNAHPGRCPNNAADNPDMPCHGTPA
jgi:hypothetical protein